LGSTAFVIDRFDAVIKGEVMVPVSEINDTRRRAVEDLERLRLSQFNRPSLTDASRIKPEFRFSHQSPVVETINRTKIDLLVKVDTIEQVEAALSGGADWLMISGERFHRTLMKQSDYERVLSRVNNQQKRIIFNLPRIIRDSNANQAEQQLAWFAELEPDAVGVANIGSLAKVSQYPKLNIHADYPLNLFNSEALSFVREMGAISATLSPELTLLQIQKLAQSDILPLECLVHGQLTLMISELCVLYSYLGKCSAATCDKICRQDEFRLQDRKGEFFPVMTDEACRMHILNGKTLSMLPHVPRLGQAGIQRIRIEACRMKPEEVCRITGYYRRAIDAGATGLPQLDIEAAEHADITRGHYFRGVL
jgi:putative protease